MTPSLSLVLSRGLLAAIACGLTAGAAHALILTGFNPTLDCTQWSTPGFTWEPDRDNTGDTPPSEAYAIEVVDGAGVVLFSRGAVARLHGPQTAPAMSLSYTAAPTANPLTLTIVSAAGNGLPQQVSFTASGSCSTLPPAVVTPVPTADFWALGGLAGALALFGAARVRRLRRG